VDLVVVTAIAISIMETMDIIKTTKTSTSNSQESTGGTNLPNDLIVLLLPL